MFGLMDTEVIFISEPLSHTHASTFHVWLDGHWGDLH